MARKRYKGKKSLKQPDEFITFSSKLLQQTIVHKNKIISALVALVVLVLIFTAFQSFSHKAEEQSLLALSEIIDRYESIRNESGDVDAYHAVKDELTQIIETYGNNSGGKLANFFLAGCSFDAGDLESSVSFYRKATSDYKNVFPFETLAKSSLGYALAQQGDHTAAAAVFEDLSAGATVSDESLFALSRQYAATESVDLERETARKLIEAYPDSIYRKVVQEKFPSLAEQPES
jgi:predicted negative regulator of RcsB-dependent stress response